MPFKRSVARHFSIKLIATYEIKNRCIATLHSREMHMSKKLANRISGERPPCCAFSRFSHLIGRSTCIVLQFTRAFTPYCSARYFHNLFPYLSLSSIFANVLQTCVIISLLIAPYFSALTIVFLSGSCSRERGNARSEERLARDVTSSPYAIPVDPSHNLHNRAARPTTVPKVLGIVSFVPAVAI